MRRDFATIVTVTLNPTIDRIIEVPGFCIGAHLHGRLLQRSPAGKAINVSRGLRAFERRSIATGWVGRESLAMFAQFANHTGFESQLIGIEGQTRENITLIDPETHTETHVRDAGPNILPKELDAMVERLRVLANPDTMVVFTGSAAPGVETPGLERLLDTCISAGAAIVIDMSGEPLRLAVGKSVWMVKPNQAELAELMNEDLSEDADVLAAARRLNERIPVVVVTLGQRGAYLLADGKILHGRTSLAPHRIRSTVGCGDSFLAGFLAGIIDPAMNAEAVLRQALATGSASAISEQPAVFNVSLVDELRYQTETRVLNNPNAHSAR